MAKPSRKRSRGKHGPKGAAHAADLAAAFVARTTEQQTQAFSAFLQQDRSLPGLLQHIQRCHTAYDTAVSKMDLQPPVACARGCSHCCRNQVSLTPPEAVYLGVHLLETFSGPKLLALRHRLATLLARIQGLTRQELAAQRHELPCVLLQDDICSVHAARPMACRGWNAVKMEQCMQSVAQRAPMTLIENHALPREVAEALQLGWLQAGHELGLEAGYLLLPRALWLLLERGALDCGEAWLQGEPFFAAWSGVAPLSPALL